MTRYHYLTDYNTGTRYSVKLAQTGKYNSDGKECIAYTVREIAKDGKRLAGSGEDYYVPAHWDGCERVGWEGAKFVLMNATNNFEMEIIR